MNVLWIVNLMFPVPCEQLGLKKNITGGWLYALGEQLGKTEGISLAIVCPYEKNVFKEFDVDGIKYFLLPSKLSTTYKKELEPTWLKVYNNFRPDIVHIHGTEFTHALSCMKRLPTLKYVISIQGMVGLVHKYYFSDIPYWQILKNVTLRDIFKMSTAFQTKKSYKKRAKFEEEYLEKSKHVIGRTHCDYSYVKAINRNITYHFCHESLRPNFYNSNKWSLNNCRKHSIFLSQGGSPIKGLHQVIKAIGLLKKDYPDIILKVAGMDITRREGIYNKIKFTGYGKYIVSLIKREKLENSIRFLGPLAEDAMIQQYLEAHLFVCPSSIENSPNSLAEAQILGVPSIASFVGGIPDMVENHRTGLLYRFEAIEELAEYIRLLFEDSTLASNLSINEAEMAKKRHDKKAILENTLSIYNKIS